MSDERLTFEHFFRTEYPSVVNMVAFIVNDRGRAEEIAQDSFAKVFDRWQKIVTYERPDRWVRRVAVRMAIRSARRERMRPRVEALAEPPRAVAPYDLDVLRAVGELPAKQRAASVLFYLEDRPVSEIADVLRCSPATVKVHLHKARKRLAELLSEEVNEDVG